MNREAAQEPPDCRGRGPEAFHATAVWLRSAYSELTFGVETTVLDDDVAVTYGTMAGRHTGDVVVWTPAGQVERVFAVRDDQAQALQLGWVPPSPAYLLRCARATRRARRAAALTPTADPPTPAGRA